MGHILPVEEITDSHNLKKVHYIPTYIANSDKDIYASPQNRLEMLEKSIGLHKKFIIDDREIIRKGKSYTYQTLEELETIYHEANLYLIIGDDILNYIHTWKNFYRILELSNIIVMNRNGNINSCDKLVSSAITSDINVFHDFSCGKIFIEKTSKINASSEEIRNRLKNNQSVSEFIQKDLDRWLESNKVY
tara:strand:+ start:125 stop:697 length:573 start_codon:yes stop_codon:yes gene_type:complete